jgi:hypothetical protein
MLRARARRGAICAFGEEAARGPRAVRVRRRVDPKSPSRWSHLVERARASSPRPRARPQARSRRHPRGGVLRADPQLDLGRAGAARLRLRHARRRSAVLRALGLVHAPRGADIADGYLALRRAEHAVQTRSGLQTHNLPEAPEDLDDPRARARLRRRRRPATRSSTPTGPRSPALFRSLLPSEAPPPSPRWADAIAALERTDRARASGGHRRRPLLREARRRSGAVRRRARSGRTSRGSLFELARTPTRPLGTRSREAYPGLAETRSSTRSSTRSIPSRPPATCACSSRASACPASTCASSATTRARCAGSWRSSARARSSARPSRNNPELGDVASSRAGRLPRRCARQVRRGRRGPRRPPSRLARRRLGPRGAGRGASSPRSAGRRRASDRGRPRRSRGRDKRARGDDHALLGARGRVPRDLVRRPRDSSPARP